MGCSCSKQNTHISSPSKVANKNSILPQDQQNSNQLNQTKEPQSNLIEEEQGIQMKKSKYKQMVSYKEEEQIHQNKEEKNAVEDNFFVEKKQSIDYAQQAPNSDDDY